MTLLNEASYQAFIGFVRTLLPRGGFVVLLIECFFDESGTHDGAAIHCVAGYIMEASQSIKFAREWQKVLSQHGLTCFHMVDCAHGNGEFSGKSKDERIAIQTKLIKIIKRRTILGLAATFDKRAHKVLMPPTIRGLDPYALSVGHVLDGVRTWIDKVAYQGEAAYFFETGHGSQAEAHRAIVAIMATEHLREGSRYAGHAFLPKKQAPGVQAADLLAWQWYTDVRHSMEGRPRRKDFQNLLESPHLTSHYGPKHMLTDAEKKGFKVTMRKDLYDQIMAQQDPGPPAVWPLSPK